MKPTPTLPGFGKRLHVQGPALLGRHAILKPLRFLSTALLNQRRAFIRSWHSCRGGAITPRLRAVLDGSGGADAAVGYMTPGRFEAVARDTEAAPPSPQGVAGALQRVPMVAPPDEHINSAIKRASRIGRNKRIKNLAAQAKNRAARQMDALMKAVAVPLNGYVKGFPNPQKLHPFEAALLDLTVKEEHYARVLGKVNSLRKSVLEVGRSYASRASSASSKREAEDIAEEGFDTMKRVYLRGSKSIEDLVGIAQKLRPLPMLDTAIPTLALVGAPNVGKSSLVQAISSGRPEVCNYPFTTRSIKLGHFLVDGRRHQLTDTPGLLNRNDADRNTMEMLTLSALQHLPTSVVFVLDLTEDCGTSLADQWRIRQEMKGRFENKIWLDVLSKADLLEDEFAEGDKMTQEATSRDPCAGAAQMASCLPDAFRISTVSGRGIAEMKKGIVSALSRQEQQQEA
ncbi:unnamed protein product [Ostreobium quekettii]|uniref:P-loop containing nucleoside triphosphate hydrolase protein n=1 Tax=Ostreobium quekettii TaxID=121088 RepID=A0A8S1IKN6_9CHLO|nr:unnamed protein product [Ostreobium quekettii]